jgi:hypothetical protein
MKHGVGSVMVWAAISWYSILLVPFLPFMAELLQGSMYVDRLGNQVHPMNQTLFPNNDAVFQDNNAAIHTAGTAQSWFEEHEGELQHFPWPAQSLYLNITETFWSVLRTRLKNRFPLSTPLKQLEHYVSGYYSLSCLYLKTLSGLYFKIV